MLLNADALYIPLKAGTVQTCVTSPPFYGLRDYGTGVWEGGDPDCNHAVRKEVKVESSTLGGEKTTTGHQQEGYRSYCKRCGAVRVDRQIGLEETPEEYVAKLVQVFREVWRVLREDGTLWLNLGDTYAANRGYQVPDGKWKDVGNRVGMKAESIGLKEKDLIGIPWMVAFALRADGWYLRSDIIWHKPNPMPESVRDRPTKAHEYIFLLSKSPRYYYDADAIAEPSVTNDLRWPYGSPGANMLDPRGKQGEGKLRSKANDFRRENSKGNPVVPGQAADVHRTDRSESTYDVNTRNKRSVWTVSTKPYPEAHFAVYPPDLIEPCILAGTSDRGQCPGCGAPWVRVVEKSKSWEPSCNCNAGEPVPQIVLDPFGGSGTTGEVAAKNRRRFVMLDLNPDYILLQKERVVTDVVLPGFGS